MGFICGEKLLTYLQRARVTPEYCVAGGASTPNPNSLSLSLLPIFLRFFLVGWFWCWLKTTELYALTVLEARSPLCIFFQLVWQPLGLAQIKKEPLRVWM